MAGSQTMPVLSPAVEATWEPSGLKVRALIASVWPCSVRCGSPVAASRTSTSTSSSRAMVVPSGLRAMSYPTRSVRYRTRPDGTSIALNGWLVHTV